MPFFSASHPRRAHYNLRCLLQNPQLAPDQRAPGGHIAPYGIAEGKDLGTWYLLDIDVQGARQLKKQIPEAVTVFILAPSRQILEQRLRARGEDREDVIKRRLRDAAEEIRNYNQYDYILVNQDLAESDAVLSAIVRAFQV